MIQFKDDSRLDSHQFQILKHETLGRPGLVLTRNRLQDSHMNCTVRALIISGLFPPSTFPFEQAFDHWVEKCRRRKM